MPERPGDMPMDERLYSGQCELSHFFPSEGPHARDAFQAIMDSPMRRWIYGGERTRRDHQSTRRDRSFDPVPDLPDYVVTSVIRFGDLTWDYRNDATTHVGRRRVFIERNQLIELDIETTLTWLSAQKGTPRYAETRKQLEEEASMNNVNNQIILQRMYDRTENGLSLLPGSSHGLRAKSEAS